MDKFLEQIKQNITESQIISFDIFDTLLLRPYKSPTDLFLHLEMMTKNHGFKFQRIKAEQIAREKLANGGGQKS